MYTYASLIFVLHMKLQLVVKINSAVVLKATHLLSRFEASSSGVKTGTDLQDPTAGYTFWIKIKVLVRIHLLLVTSTGILIPKLAVSHFVRGNVIGDDSNVQGFSWSNLWSPKNVPLAQFVVPEYR